MEEQDQLQQQQIAVGGPSTRKGEGYTVRLNGKKALKTKVLEKQIQETELEFQELMQQNQALRAKEEQQLKLLGWYDAWSRIGKSDPPGSDVAEEPCASTQSDSSSALPAPERLERRSQRLLNSLRPHGPAEVQDTASGPMQPSRTSAQGSGSGSRAAASTAARSAAGTGASATDAQAAAKGGEDHMSRWFSQLDPAELAIYRTMTPQAFAVRLRAIIARLALARRQGSSKADLAACFDVLEDMGMICALQAAANEDVIAQISEINMETLEVEAIPADHWTRVMHAARLTKQQRAALSEAFERFNQGMQAVLLQQQSLLQELQATLGVGLPAPGARATAAALAADAGAAGPAHFMSLATGGPVLPGAAAAAGVSHTRGDGGAATTATAAGSPCDLLHTGTAFSADELQFLSDWLAEHKACGAQPSSGSRSSWLAPAGVLPLAVADKAEALMKQLSRNTGGWKVCLHQLTVTFVNALTTAQRADAMLACYPFMLVVPQFCGCVAEAETEQQARATKVSGRRQN